MKTYTIKKVNKAFNWNDIPTLEVSEIMWLPDAGIGMKQQLCYDDTAIYVHQMAIESNIRAEEKEQLSAICNDSCMEFFIDFAGDGRYFNFEINSIGNMYLGFGKERASRMRMILKKPVERFEIKTSLTDDGWEVFYKIPMDFIRTFYPGYELCSGTKVRANCYKCGDKTVVPHYLAWNPLTIDTPDYHRPQDFGEMIFE